MKRLTFKHAYEHYRCGEMEPMTRVSPENDFTIIDEPVKNNTRGFCRDNIGYPYPTHDRYLAGAVVDKLYQYEELGYEPEELAEIIKEHNELERIKVKLDVTSLYPKFILTTSRACGKTQLLKAIDDYLVNDVNSTKKVAEAMKFAIDKVIFNDPATIVFWCDGTKTVVKTQNGEEFDPEKGLMAAITKRALGDKGNYYNVIEKWVGEYEAKKAETKDAVAEALNKLSTTAEQAGKNIGDAMRKLSKDIKKKGRGMQA